MDEFLFFIILYLRLTLAPQRRGFLFPPPQCLNAFLDIQYVILKLPEKIRGFFE